MHIYICGLLVAVLILVQLNDFYTKSRLDVICRQFGYIRENPASCIGWALFVILAFYFLTYNSKTSTKQTNFLLFAILGLIFVTNVDYIYRGKTQDESTLYSIPHYFLSLIVIISLIYLTSIVYSKKVSIPIMILFVAFFILNLFSLPNRKNHQQLITLIENVLVNVCIILLIYHTHLHFTYEQHPLNTIQ